MSFSSRSSEVFNTMELFFVIGKVSHGMVTLSNFRDNRLLERAD